MGTTADRLRQSIKSSPGSVPLFHFSSTSPNSNLWDTHPTYTQFKSILLDFFRGVEMDAVSLKGLERVISVTIGGEAEIDSAAAQTDVEHAVAGKGKEVQSIIDTTRPKGSGGDYDEEKGLPLVHFRTYTLTFMRSGVPTPLVALSPHGPHLTFEMRRTQLPSAEMWKASMKKTVKKVASGTKKNKNVDSAFYLFAILSNNDTDQVCPQSTRWETRLDEYTSILRICLHSKVRLLSLPPLFLRSSHMSRSKVQGTQEGRAHGRRSCARRRGDGHWRGHGQGVWRRRRGEEEAQDRVVVLHY